MDNRFIITDGVCGNDNYYVSRTPDKVVDVFQQHIPLDIPDFDTSEYGWINTKE